jgi:hypothetical protein
MVELFFGIVFGAVILFSLVLSWIRPDLIDDDDDYMG